MAQNVYDTPEFFAAYSALPRQVDGLAAAPEWPAVRALLPPLDRRSVIDLGCGFGWFCRWAREQGVADVLGVDLSENMLTRARAMTEDAAIVYERGDLDALVLPEASFDLAYSSLALHYVADLARLFATLHRALKPGGYLVFSAEHPIATAPRHDDFVAGADGRQIWPLDDCLKEGPRMRDWLIKGVVKQHRTVATYLNRLIAAGFRIAQIEEWGPSAEQIAVDPSLAIERVRPPFLLVKAER